MQSSHRQQARIPSSDVTEFQKVLRSSKNIIVVSGAGLSAASGIPTFRDNDGLWRIFPVMSLARPEAFKANPSRVWQFYHYRREKANSSYPNNAHWSLAYLSFPSNRSHLGLRPDSTFCHITQNVDCLSQRAEDYLSRNSQVRTRVTSKEAPSLIMMHGRINDVWCTNPQSGSICEKPQWKDPSLPLCPALIGTEIFVEGSFETPIPTQDLPKCSYCGALARPGVVWFSEPISSANSKQINKAVQKADLCLVVGTSSSVTPAANYASVVRRNWGKVAVFNMERTEGDSLADFLFLGPCEKRLPECLGLRFQS